LLNTLFDGHPRLYVHPYELLIGHPTKHDWPALDVNATADQWLDVLREARLVRLFNEGYMKFPDSPGREAVQELPFLIVPSFVERLFRVLCAESAPKTAREILDRYFTAFFNAWLDYQGINERPKSWVVGFAPRLAWAPSRERFFADYPDGRIIAVLRDPRSWYASASRFRPRYEDLGDALALWRRGATEMEQAKRERPTRVYLVTYDALTRDTEHTMGELARWLDLSWGPELARPTFNRSPVVPNSSHGLMAAAVQQESRTRWRDVLSPTTVDEIERSALDLYRQVGQLADRSET
jgi:hypothetical protein